MVTLPLTVLKNKGKHCMAEEPSHVQRASLSYLFEIGLRKYEQLLLKSQHLKYSYQPNSTE
jgi:hypothetical protein